MLKSLYELRIGLISPKSFNSEVILQQALDLELSEHVFVRRNHGVGITALDLERIDERYLLSGGKDGSITIYDLLNTSERLGYTSEAVARIRPSENAHQFCIVRVQWYPFDTGLFTTSAMDKKLKIWDANYLEVADTILMESSIISHDMSTIASRHNLIAVALTDPHITLYDPRCGSWSHQLRAHRTGVRSVKWSPTSENLLASGGVDSKIYFWDVRSAKGYLKSLDHLNGEAIGSKKDILTAHDGQVTSLKFTDDGLYLVSQGSDRRLRLWDVALSKNTLVNYGLLSPWSSRSGLPTSMAICWDSSTPVLFVPSNNDINVYDLYTGLKLKTLMGHLTLVHSCVFRSNTNELYSGGNDKNIHVWSPNVKRESEEAKSLPVKVCSTQMNFRNSEGTEWNSDEY